MLFCCLAGTVVTATPRMPSTSQRGQSCGRAVPGSCPPDLRGAPPPPNKTHTKEIPATGSWPCILSTSHLLLCLAFQEDEEEEEVEVSPTSYFKGSNPASHTSLLTDSHPLAEVPWFLWLLCFLPESRRILMTEMGQADALIGPCWSNSLSFPEQRPLVTLLEHSDLSWISVGVFGSIRGYLRVNLLFTSP